MSDTPASNLDLITDTDGLRNYLEKVREHQNSLAMALHEAAGILRWSIKSMNEADSKMIARQVTRPLDRCGSLNEAAAKAAGLTWNRAASLLIPAPRPIQRGGAGGKPFERKKP